MKTVRLEDVESIMRWRDRSSAKDGYLQREMFDKYFTLVMAYKLMRSAETK